MKKNRFVNGYDDSITWLEALAIFSIVSAIVIIVVNVRLYEKMTTPAGQLDCSKCHSLEHHETKKMVKYLEKQGYKNPRKYIQVDLKELEKP